ncbi:MAG: NADP-dependent phosphogluconate dehydrogenase [bacterium]|nr:NADP-dependent phosphogluconate dehydrogenase [bacterium]
MKADIAMIGLGVMGASLARNMEHNGYRVTVYNRSQDVLAKFMQEYSDKKFIPAHNFSELVATLDRPRKICLMVNAGAPVDAVIEGLLPFLEKGDIVIDLGNSYFKDTERREKFLDLQGIFFLGVGVSGGEEGALNGASIMPGGQKGAWQEVKDIFDAVSAKAPTPCHTYIGSGGSGHFVKMIHNGIEYADMELIAESYDILRKVGGFTPQKLEEVFCNWNKGPLSSFLIEITSKIFAKQDDLADGFILDKILDKAEQKGTGRWTIEAALELGIPAPTLALAVESRNISAKKDLRAQILKVSSKAPTPKKFEGDLIKAVHDALYASKILAYAQGFHIISEASVKNGWQINLKELSTIWRGGCIIRAKFLELIIAAYKENSALTHLLLAPSIAKEITDTIQGLREIVSQASLFGIPVLGFSSALSYYDAFASNSLPHNLIQAQRDFFGAHTFERNDRQGKFHVKWE